MTALIRWLLPVFSDEKTGRASSAKIGVIICFSAITYKFLQIPPVGITYDLILAYGACGGLHNALIFLIKRKYPDASDTDARSVFHKD